MKVLRVFMVIPPHDRSQSAAFERNTSGPCDFFPTGDLTESAGADFREIWRRTQRVANETVAVNFVGTAHT
jgi:hypothetical protein